MGKELHERQESGWLKNCWRSCLTLLSNPWIIVCFTLLGVVAKEAVGRYIFDGKPVVEVLSWLWTTVSTLTERPLVQLAMIPLALWMFARGVQSVQNNQERIAAEKDAILAIAKDQLMAENLLAQKSVETALLPSQQMAEAFMWGNRLDGLRQEMAKWGRQIDDYAAWTGTWKSERSFHNDDATRESLARLPSDICAVDLTMFLKCPNVAAPIVNLDRPKFELGGSGREKKYLPSENVEYCYGLTRNLGEMNTWLKAVEHAYHHEKNEYDRFIKKITWPLRRAASGHDRP